MAEHQNPKDRNAPVKRQESEQDAPSKMMAPPPFSLGSSHAEAPAAATPGADVGLGLDKKKEE